MARRSQCSSAGDNPLNPNYLPPHYREEYRLAIDALVEEDLEGYYQFLQRADVVDFLSSPEIQYIQESVQVPQLVSQPEPRFLETGADGSSDTYWPIHSDLDAPGLDLGWPQLHHLIGPTEVTTLVNPPEPDMPSIKEQARRLIKNAQQVHLSFSLWMETSCQTYHNECHWFDCVAFTSVLFVSFISPGDCYSDGHVYWCWHFSWYSHCCHEKCCRVHPAWQSECTSLCQHGVQLQSRSTEHRGEYIYIKNITFWYRHCNGVIFLFFRWNHWFHPFLEMF